MNRSWAAVLGVAILAAAAGVYFQTLGQRATEPGYRLQLLEKLPVVDPDGKARSLDQWRGKVLVVNFWATWCEPCRKEIPALIRVQTKYASKGVQVVGIAIDSADKVVQFAKEFGIDYPLLIGNLETMEVVRALGNQAGALPYTLVLDRDGKVVRTRLGGISEAELVQALLPLSG